MRHLRRNQRPLWYALRLSSTAVTDENGYLTGEYELTYSNPQCLRCNISAAVGQEAIQAFGELTDYSRTISVSNTSCPLKEGTRIWFGVKPNEEADNFNYVVIRKADSPNSLLFALREVGTNAEDDSIESV